MGNTTWKQVVLDTADAYREANGTTDKIPVGQLAEKVRAGAGIPYEGDNPLTVGQEGYTFPAKTLLKEGLQIVNGVNGEDLTAEMAEQTTAVNMLMQMVQRKVADHRGEGLYAWKKSMVAGVEYVISVEQTTTSMPIVFRLSCDKDLSTIDASLLVGKTITSAGGYTLAFTSETEATLNTGSTTKSCTYTYTSGTVSLTISGVTSMATSTWSDIAITVEDLSFMSYVISADIDAYPDGAIHTDGYWYELVKEGVDLSEIGLTGIACGTFTVSSAATKLSEVEIVHNLGVIPKLVAVFIVAGSLPTTSATTYFREGVKYPSIDDMCFINCGTISSSSNRYDGSCSSTETTFHLVKKATGTTGQYYAKGCTYGWIIAG